MGPMSFVARDTAFSRCQSDQSNDGVRFINSERMAPTVTVDPAALVSREGTREMIRINTGSEVILHAAHVLPAGVCGTSTFLGMTLCMQNLDLGFIDSDALDTTAPIHRVGFLQFEAQLCSGVTAKARDWQVISQAYDAGARMT